MNSPGGRYIISLDAVAAKGRDHPEDIVFHDGDHLSEACNTDDIRIKSRFNDIEWALDKGYRRCLHCMGEPA